MSSRRFPGKVLAPFQGVPVIRRVVSAVERALPSAPLVVATSVEPSDDPLAAYLETIGVRLFRGPLDDVFERFRRCLSQNPCDWILRVSADSPLLDAGVLRAVAEREGAQDCDLVTTVFPRTFPRGWNCELVRTRTFVAIDPSELTAHDREHVTSFYYRHPSRFGILNVASDNPRLSELNLAVDTIQDLRRLEQLGPAGIPVFDRAPTVSRR